MPFFGAFLGRQVEQHGFDAGVDQCAAICAPMTPAPSTATLRMRRDVGGITISGWME